MLRNCIGHIHFLLWDKRRTTVLAGMSVYHFNSFVKVNQYGGYDIKWISSREKMFLFHVTNGLESRQITLKYTCLGLTHSRSVIFSSRYFLNWNKRSQPPLQQLWCGKLQTHNSHQCSGFQHCKHHVQTCEHPTESLVLVPGLQRTRLRLIHDF